MSTQEVIVACLHALAGPPQGMPPSDAQMPTPWILLDLMAMLPDGNKLKASTGWGYKTLARDLSVAEQDASAAAKAAAKLCLEIARHQGPRQQLADFLSVSPGSLKVVLAGLQQAGPAAGEAASSIAAAAWRSFAASSWQLQGQGTLGAAELDRAVCEACAGMAAATQLTECAWLLLRSPGALQLVQGAIREVGARVLVVLQNCWQHTHRAVTGGICSRASRQQLQQLAGWWAARAIYVTCHADRSSVWEVCKPALASAHHFLSISLPDMQAQSSIGMSVLQQGSLLHMSAALLADIMQCSQGCATVAARDEARGLLQAHGPELVRLLHGLLARPADPHLMALQLAAIGGDARAALQVQSASVEYVQAVGTLLDATGAARVGARGDAVQLLSQLMCLSVL